MEFALDPRHYVSVPVLLWPVLFLRLWSFYWWQQHHGRAVIFAVTPQARIVIRFIEDDPRDLNTWIARNQFERPHLAAMDNADGALEVNPIVILVAGWLEYFGGREVWVDGLKQLRPVPPFLDSG